MEDGKHCPDCAKDIGVWPVVLATLPNRIRCPHCSSRLGYRVTAGLIVTIILILTIILIGLGVAAAAFWPVIRYGSGNPGRPIALLAGVLIVPTVLAEVAITAYLRRRGTLERTDSGDAKTIGPIR